MARRKKNQPIEATGEITAIQDGLEPVGVEGLAPDAPVSAPEPTVTPKEKITVTLGPDGSLDLEAMRDKTRERLVEALRRSHSDLIPKMPEAPIKRWPDFAVRAIYSGLGTLETMAAARTIPAPIAEQVFMFSDAEIEALMEPTQAVLSKHAGRLDRWHEETALALTLLQIHFAKMFALKQIMREYQATVAAAEADKAKTRTPGPGPANDPLREPGVQAIPIDGVN